MYRSGRLLPAGLPVGPRPWRACRRRRLDEPVRTSAGTFAGARGRRLVPRVCGQTAVSLPTSRRRSAMSARASISTSVGVTCRVVAACSPRSRSACGRAAFGRRLTTAVRLGRFALDAEWGAQRVRYRQRGRSDSLGPIRVPVAADRSRIRCAKPEGYGEALQWRPAGRG